MRNAASSSGKLSEAVSFTAAGGVFVGAVFAASTLAVGVLAEASLAASLLAEAVFSGAEAFDGAGFLLLSDFELGLEAGAFWAGAFLLDAELDFFLLESSFLPGMVKTYID